MTGGSVDREQVLVLGLGNLLLSDDGVGLRLLEGVAGSAPAEFLDGGTQGLALLPYFAGRRALIILDAVALGAPAGTVHLLTGASLRAHRATTAHGSNALELLEVAALLGELPPSVTIIGIEPARIATGIGLSAEVECAVPEAVSLARRILESAIAPPATASHRPAAPAAAVPLAR
jgi:hydrogenase maturation protease